MAEPLSFELSWRTARDPSHYIYISRTETQPSANNWCAAYVTAAILRTQVGGGFTARQIMEYYYGSGVSTSESLSRPQAAAYARDVAGLTATTVTERGLSNSQLMAQIDDDLPVYLSMENVNNDSSHAVALRGYAMSVSQWSIWDPINGSGYESFPFNGRYVSTTGNIFEYNGGTIYNFY